jgi:hypothetical protein
MFLQRAAPWLLSAANRCFFSVMPPPSRAQGRAEDMAARAEAPSPGPIRGVDALRGSSETYSDVILRLGGEAVGPRSTARATFPLL